jgi:hypothetical protein
MTEKRQNTAAKKIVPRRPKKLFNGSESQQPLYADGLIFVWRGCQGGKHLQERGCYVRGSINETNEPIVTVVVWVSNRRIYSESDGERKIGTVRAGLIPSPARHNYKLF